MDQSYSMAWGLVYCYSHHQDKNCTTSCKFTLRIQTTWRNRSTHSQTPCSQGYWHQAHSLLWRFQLGCPTGGWHLECAEPYDGGISRRSGRDSQELLGLQSQVCT